MEKNLDVLREEIDQIDEKLVELFAMRMRVCGDVARYKLSVGKNVFDPEREQKKLASIAELSGEEMRDYTASLYSLIFELSKAYQQRIIDSYTEVL